MYPRSWTSLLVAVHDNIENISIGTGTGDHLGHDYTMRFIAQILLYWRNVIMQFESDKCGKIWINKFE